MGNLRRAMTKTEAAQFLEVGIRSLERYSSSGRITARKLRTRTGHVADYDESELARFKEELANPPATSSPSPASSSPPSASAASPVEGANGEDEPKAIALVDKPRRENRHTSPDLATLLPTTLARRGEEVARPVKKAPDPFVTSIRLVLTVAEASLLTGFSAARIKEAIGSGSLKARRIGRAWRIRRADLEAWVADLF